MPAIVFDFAAINRRMNCKPEPQPQEEVQAKQPVRKKKTLGFVNPRNLGVLHDDDEDD